jgi:tRNA pseudouridine32 synthase / 23S rRNA pseudouridine746 synthase
VLKPHLPTVGGVSPSRRKLPAGGWETVLEFLLESFPQVGAATWAERMSKGLVADEEGRPLHPSSPYRAGGYVFYYRESAAECSIPFEERVLYRDEHLLVADKPHFLPVIPAGRFLHETLLVRLKKNGAPEDLVPLHRIDRETAGVVLFSVNPKTRGLYGSLFHEREVGKVYEALAPPSASLDFPLTRRSRIVPGEPFFRMREEEGEPNSETHVEVVESGGDVARYRLRPVTGRKHQLRLHLSAMGIPILNDRLYPRRTPVMEDDFDAPLKLLARSVAFLDPVTGRERYFESEREL